MWHVLPQNLVHWTKRWTEEDLYAKTEEDLYAKYGISASEVDFIEKVVRPMELTSGSLSDAANVGDSKDD
jgi:hypothetical protein